MIVNELKLVIYICTLLSKIIQTFFIIITKDWSLKVGLHKKRPFKKRDVSI